jgi:hypothetical protein
MDCYDFEIELFNMENNDFDLIFLNTNEIVNIAIYFLYVFE